MLDAPQQYSLIESLAKGGWMMLPLLICSVIALAIIIERLINGPRKARVIPAMLEANVMELLERGRLDEILGLCRGKDSPLARIVAVAVTHVFRPREQIIEALEFAGRKEIARLQRYVGILGVIAAITPLLGLLGTVFGMIKTFAVIQVQGVGNASALSGGISEALITTATGLSVAVPSLVFYRLFIAQTKRRVLEMEEIALDVVHHLEENAAPTQEPLQKGNA